MNKCDYSLFACLSHTHMYAHTDSHTYFISKIQKVNGQKSHFIGNKTFWSVQESQSQFVIFRILKKPKTWQ